MNTPNTGTAREIEPGRLAAFEDAGDLDMPTMPSLPPRRPPSTPSTPSTPAGRPAPARAGARPQDRGRSRVSAVPANGSGTAPEERPAAAPTEREGDLKGPEDRVRPSNVHIPVALLDPIEADCKQHGLSHGEVIIVAIENAHPRLKDLVHPAATAGGSIFASRRSRASRATDGPLTPLNYRLREADFATLDRLVEEFGASSRGHLITAALNDYFLGDR